MTSALTSEAKEAMRSYFLRMVVLPGSVLSVVAFALGYLVNDVADSKAEAKASVAYAEAMRDASERIHNLTIQATESKEKAEAAQQDIEAILEKNKTQTESVATLLDRIEKVDSLSQSIGDQEKIAELVTATLSKDTKFLRAIDEKVRKSVTSEIYFGPIPCGDFFRSSKGIFREDYWDIGERNDDSLYNRINVAFTVDNVIGGVDSGSFTGWVADPDLWELKGEYNGSRYSTTYVGKGRANGSILKGFGNCFTWGTSGEKKYVNGPLNRYYTKIYQ